MMKRTRIGFLLAASAWCVPALVGAQPPPAPVPPAGAPLPPPDSLFFVTTAAPLRLDVLGAEGVVPGGVVKDKPYSADSITESTQILADGNRITHKNEARVYRDSQGRTRREQTMASLGVFQAPSAPITTITINDPVAGTTYFLDPAAHTARKVQRFRLELGGGADGSTATFERAVPPPGDDPSAAGAAVASAPLPFPPPPALEPGLPAGGVVELRGVARTNGAFGSGTVVARALGSTEPSTEDLGEQVLEGVLAHGTRETSTIPAGALGNERAIVITSERWYSPDIDAVVSSKTSDPRFGETSYQLLHVVRAEPAPDLFTLPSGYELQADAGFSHAGARMVAPGDPAAAGARVDRVFVVEPGAKPGK